MMNSIFTEDKINELCNSSVIPKIKDYIFENKSYLNMKRKRSPKLLKEGIKSLEKLKNKIKKDSEPTIKQNEKAEVKKKAETLKFQTFSKNIYTVIFAYLRIDDLLKLKNIGSHNIRLYINELLDLKKSDNNLNLNEIESKSTLYMNYYDSLNCQKYFLINGGSKIKINKNLKIKYALYHKATNKNYVLIHYKLKYFFCDTENESNIFTLGKDVQFTLPDKDYYEKFQFLEEFNKSEVAIFSLYKILLYNLSTKVKDHCICLRRSCDYILYKKELKLLIVPHLPDEIEFFKIYSGKTYIKDSKHIFNAEESCFENSENPIVLNFNDYIKNDNFDSLICIYNRGGKKIFIFDCKLLKLVHTIISNSKINRVNIHNKYLISITGKNINYYSINNNQYSFLNSFNLNDISKNANIKYISLLDSKFFYNMFLIITHNPNKNIYKSILFFLENNSNKFYYSLTSLKNEITDYIYDDELICNFCIKEKINDENIVKMKIVISHLKKYSRNLSSDNIRNAKNCLEKDDSFIKEYCVTL